MKETNIVREILKAITGIGARAFRQNTGMGWAGQATRINHDTVVVKHARPLHAGLCKGSSDIIGWTPVEITPDMVGQRVAVFTAIEVKKSSRATQQQIRFINAVNAAGGIAGIAHSPDEALRIVGKFTESRT